MANRFVKDPHEFVKAGQIVKVKVMEVEVKRQRISLTMRLDDAPGAPSRAADARTEASPRDRQSPEPKRPLLSDPKPGGAIAMALERAKLKK
jgi:protein Tex